jgi:hypothetical protein
MTFLFLPRVPNAPRALLLHLDWHRCHAGRLNTDLRIIVLKDWQRPVMGYVGLHDAAYRWAERHTARPERAKLTLRHGRGESRVEQKKGMRGKPS